MPQLRQWLKQSSCLHEIFYVDLIDSLAKSDADKVSNKKVCGEHTSEDERNRAEYAPSSCYWPTHKKLSGASFKSIPLIPL